jgi:eukaryotic-like serine/threonine-protein kinase
VRRTIVAEALTYLERLSSDPGVDDALRLELAKAYHRIGRVQGLPSQANLGDREGALRSLNKAVELLRPMTTRPIVPRDAALEFGKASLSLATTANTSGQRDTALAAARDAAAVAESQIRQMPDDSEARRLGASALFQAASLAADSDCLALWQRAGASFETLLAERPDDPDRQRNVALVEKYIGAYYDRQADYGSSLPHHRRALAMDENRLAGSPVSRRAQFDVAVDLSNVGLASLNSKRLPEAAAAYERSIQMRTALAESDPTDVLARSRLAIAASKLALTYLELGRIGPALGRARQAVRLSESLAHLDSLHRAYFADALTTTGRVEEKAGQTAAACAAFQRSRDLIATIPERDPEASEYAGHLSQPVKAGLAYCEAASHGVMTSRRHRRAGRTRQISRRRLDSPS